MKDHLKDVDEELEALLAEIEEEEQKERERFEKEGRAFVKGLPRKPKVPKRAAFLKKVAPDPETEKLTRDLYGD